MTQRVTGVTKHNLFYFLLISGTLLSTPTLSADIDFTTLPAVSEFNGKVEFGGGTAGSTILGNSGEFYGAASLSIPLGERFGLQADFANVNAFGQNSTGAAAHLFARDPKSYLIGGLAGYANFGAATGAWVGPEAELYLDNISIEATAGYMSLTPNGAASQDKFFALGDIGLYATDNLRLTVGASSIADFKSAHAGMEWLLSDTGMPVSFKADGRIGDDNFYSLTAGISFYFGGPEKSLIRRHREDDPRNRVFDIFSAGGVHLGHSATVPLPDCIYVEGNPINAPCIPSA